MSEGVWWDPHRRDDDATSWANPDPAYAVRRFDLHAETFAYRLPVSRELLESDDPRRRLYRTEILRDATEQSIMATEREVYQGTVPTGTQTFPLTVTVPYAVSVVVPIRRGWWARLRGRPVEYETVHAGGTVEAAASVRVDYEATFRYPEFVPNVGTPVPTGHARAWPDVVRVEAVSTGPGWGPHVSESRRTLRCPPPPTGCGHHAIGHPDQAGCVIGGCNCRRVYIERTP